MFIELERLLSEILHVRYFLLKIRVHRLRGKEMKIIEDDVEELIILIQS